MDEVDGNGWLELGGGGAKGSGVWVWVPPLHCGVPEAASGRCSGEKGTGRFHPGMSRPQSEAA